MGFSLVPRDSTFDTMLARGAELSHQTAMTLQRMLENYPATAHMVHDIKKLEHEGDRVMRDLVKELHSTFITPIDREDIYELATAIDDVIDHIDEAASMFDIYRVESITAAVHEQAGILVAATAELSAALTSLDAPAEMERHWQNIHQLEDAGDSIMREGIREVFAACYHEPAVIICWKDIYWQLEKSIDACERAATVLEAVAVKMA